MITLKDFMEKGYSVKATSDYPERRRICREEGDYPKLLDIARGLDSDGWTAISDAIKKEFSGKYWLVSYTRSGGKIESVEVYFDDQGARRSTLEKGSSSIAISYDTKTGKVYQVEDVCRRDSWGLLARYDACFPENKTADDIMDRIKKDRESERKKTLAYYNKLLKDTKKEYRERLAYDNAIIKDI